MLDTRKWLDQYSETISVGSVTSAKLASKIEANSEDDLILTPKSVKFYRRHFLGEFFFDLLALATAGLSLLFCKWYLEFHVRLRYRETDDQDPLAEVALITSLDDTLDLVQILTFDESGGKYHNEWVENRPHVAAHGRLRMFLWRQERFWNIQEGKEAGSTMWVRRAFKLDRPYNELHHIAAERAIDRLDLNLETKKMIRLTTYGENVTEIVVPPFYKMVITEALKPFFIFQLMSICVWFAQEYYIYTYSVIFMTMYSILANSYSEWKNLQALKAIAKSDSSIEKVRISTSSPRVLQTESVSTSSLLPGDLVRVTSNMILPCDVLLIMGNALLSEAMLTGESAPVMKYALPANDGDSCFRPDAERDKKYILYSGTKVLQAKCSAPPFSKDPVPLEDVKNIWEFREDSKSQVFPVAMVLKTGFSTARGQLIRAIMYPKPPKFDFEKQGYRFIWVLVGFLVVGCTVQIIVYAKHRESVKTTILDLLNLVTVAVPPALPLSLSIGLQVSLFYQVLLHFEYH